MIRALLVDDEAPARERLKRLLDAHADVVVVDEAGDGRQALDKIARHGPDLLFLDIEMPVHSGIEVASALPPPRPQIIFCTAFDSYAIEAFEHNAVDYLLKPVNRRRLAKSLERIRRVQRERSRSREVEEAGSTQQLLFPKQAAGAPHSLDYYGSCRPAREVGGDYYDFIPLAPGRLGFAVGDVAGKGVYAGLLMAGLQGRLQSRAAGSQHDLGGLFSEMNQRIWSTTAPDKYATLFYAVFDGHQRRLTSVNAGHPPPLLWRGGRLERLESGGLPLGLFPTAEYSPETVDLACGDLALLFSDGLVEATDPLGNEFGDQRLVEVAQAHLSLSARRLHNEVMRGLDAFRQGEPPADDLTLVVLRVQ